MLLNKKQQQTPFTSSLFDWNRLSSVNFSQDDFSKTIQNLVPNKAHGHDKIRFAC